MGEDVVLAELSRAQFGATMAGYMLGLVILTIFCVTRARSQEDHPTPRRWSWTRINLFLIFTSSFLFVLSGLTCLLISVRSSSDPLCKSSMYVCVEIYGITKTFFYFFLIEKVHVVWNSLSSRPRRRSVVYLSCLATTIVYIPAILLLYPLKGYIYGSRRQDGVCAITFQHLAAIPVVAYDTFITVLLTALFLWPLLRRRLINVELRSLARRTFVTSAVALSASIFNLAIIYSHNSTEPMWVCMGSCNLDIMTSAIAVFWSTRPTPRPVARSFELSNRPDLMPTFARPSTDTMDTVGQHDTRPSAQRPTVLAGDAVEGLKHYVVSLKEVALPNRSSVTTLQSFGDASVK